MNLLNLLKLSYWFSQPQTARGGTVWIYLIILSVIILLGVAAKIWMGYMENKGNKEVFRRLGNLFLTVGIVSLIWFYFRQQIVAFLAWRFWLLILMVFALWWAYKIHRYWKKRVPVIKEEQAEKARIEKYLPKAKK